MSDVTFERVFNLMTNEDVAHDHAPNECSWLRYHDGLRDFLKMGWDKRWDSKEFNRQLNMATFLSDDDKWEFQEWWGQLTILIEIRKWSK